ncbi:DUF2306 domain-containing protein [Paracrocinitomix mangrovi]|uniref:DUF2306 domain-containing protein n=1 Tax=Paracrocinitomix mangrovi TaxID=2862509 RepID=UPI001C8D3C24|nr:DUF2306 domain-containing protein [Paracrocinitomix mangrovi]UKN01060.1 DUF2306 domain-containing protein [Paracrocinitomix mangrovi]
MENIAYYTFIILHIAAGHLALLAGIIIFIRKKGDQKHKVFGKIYTWSMLTIAFSAFYLSIAKNIPFLFLINVFVLYQLSAGWLSVRKKMKPINILEVILLVVFIVNGTYMITTGNVVLIGFGALSILLAINEIRFFYGVHKQKIAANKWLARHIGLMIGSFIGAVTAFAVVNIRFVEPAWIVWFAPTVIMVPLIQIWTKKYVPNKAKV